MLHQGGKRTWNPEDELPRISWRVEEDLEISVDLPLALKEALQFNPWDGLAREAGS